jgi:hypothetical protein
MAPMAYCDVYGAIFDLKHLVNKVLIQECDQDYL